MGNTSYVLHPVQGAVEIFLGGNLPAAVRDPQGHVFHRQTGRYIGHFPVITRATTAAVVQVDRQYGRECRWAKR